MPPAKKQRVAATADDAISIASSSSGKSRAGGTPSSSSSIEIIEPRRSARVAKVAQAQKDAPPSPASTSSGSTSRIKRVIKPRASRTVLTRADYEAPIFEDDGDVVMDDDFAMALRYQSPELEFDKALYGGEEYDGDGIGFVESVVKTGLSLWVADTKVCEGLVGPAGWVVEGYAGMEGTVLDLKGDEKEMSVKFRLAFEDMDGSSFTYALLILFTNLATYPKTCDTLIQAPAPPPIRRSHQKIFERFTTIHDLPLQRLITRLLCALQGDDDANGGKAEEVLEDDEDYDEGLVGFDDDDELGQIGRGFEVAQGCHGDLGKDWGRVKVDFLQAKSRGYRPGLTKISDYWVVSYSIPLKSMDIDPNELAIWDDDLVEAWEDDMRFILLMRMDKYGASYADTKWALTLDKDYKPSDEEISRQTVTRRRGPAPRNSNSTTTPELPPRTFFLSDALTSHLKVFPRCYQLRVSYPLTWDSADRYGMDDAEISKIFDEEMIPTNIGDCTLDPADPIELGLTENLPLVAFYWICRRFTKAPKYCLNCGVGVQVEGRRPYVCDKALCLYGMMSLGLGPSLSHTIQTHPGVVDLLLSFAHAAASSTTRMDFPSGINIDVPPSSGLCETSTPLDDLPEPERRRALVYLIESLPRISFIAAHLNSGLPLSDLYSSMHPGAMTVLRWTVGTCRAYLKETRAGEGVVNDQSAPVAATPNYGAGVVSANIRQFSFVVGDPEQEEAFAEEIREARKVKPSLGKYPTMLAFHGSGAERWHNILRTGLDFNEIACGRAYGNGVYFAADSGISMGSYARPNTTRRPNADFAITRATALCELVNVPETFVSRQPYYVINKVKQIKPFLLLVEGIAAPPIVPPPKTPLGPDGEIAMTVTQDPADVVVPPVKMERKRSGGAGERRFLHDPTLQLKATYFQRPLEVNMPEKIARATFIDTQPDTPSDAALYKSPIIEIPDSPPPIRKSSYTPATEEFYKQITMLPPPSATSPRATKAIMRELKAVMKAQKEGVLPFWLVPDSDRLFSWTLELFEFDDDSILKKEMKKLGIKSMIAELRFGASFPASPPFMRIIYPRCLPFASGGGGNITAGGSVCNEILTTSGWNPTFCMEAMIRDIMLNMTAADRPARIDPHRWQMPYGIHEAVEAYKRVATHHGWEIPKDFEQMALT